MILISFLIASCGQHKSGAENIPTLSYQSDSAANNVISIKHQNNSIKLKSSEEMLDGLELIDDQRKCYVQKESLELRNIRVCQTPAVVSVFAYLKSDDGIDHPQRFVFKRNQDVLSEKAPSKNPTNLELETPKTYTLQELVQITKKKSFTTRQALDQLKMARDNMRLHYLNLLPHLSINSALALATFSGPLSILGAIGDLVPFLLPSRWFEAKETEHLYKAQAYGAKIASEDSVQVVEGLFLAFARDQQNFDQFVQHRNHFISTIKLVQELEEAGKLPIGRSRDIESPLNLFDQMLNTLGEIVETEQAELSFAVGFHNPEAIKGLEIGTLLDSVNPDDVKIEADSNVKVLSTSLELMQMDEVIKAAALEKKGKIFQWLDPYLDAQAGLGFGLPMNIALSKDNLKYLKGVKEQLSASLVQKIYYANKDYAGSTSNYHLAKAGVELQSQRIKTALEELMTKPNDTPVGQLQDSLNQLALQQTNLTASLFANLAAKSRINRLLHLNLYHTK
jgi:hypothetical protein